MYYEGLTNDELIKKLKTTEDFDSALVVSVLICERAGLAASVSNLDSILRLAIERLTA